MYGCIERMALLHIVFMCIRERSYGGCSNGRFTYICRHLSYYDRCMSYCLCSISNGHWGDSMKFEYLDDNDIDVIDRMAIGMVVFGICVIVAGIILKLVGVIQ